MEQLLTAKEVAARLGLAAKTVREWGRDGKIPVTILPGNNIRFKESVVDSWLDRRTTKARNYSSQKTPSI